MITTAVVAGWSDPMGFIPALSLLSQSLNDGPRGPPQHRTLVVKVLNGVQDHARVEGCTELAVRLVGSLQDSRPHNLRARRAVKPSVNQWPHLRQFGSLAL